MPIRIECPSCQARFTVSDEAAGRRGRCPKCKGEITVPTPHPAEPEIGLVPDEDDSASRHRSATPSVVPSTQAIAMAQADAQASGAADDGAGYDLMGAAPRAVHRRVRERAASRTEAPLKADGQAAASSSAPRRTPAQILAAFGQGRRIEPVRPTPLYRLWVAITALLMVLLPLAYVALIGLVAYGLYYHAVHDLSVFHDVQGRNAGRGAFLLYVGPLVAGAVVLAFMLKPLFARPSGRYKSRSLDPSKEPLLFAFVDGVCQAVGSPRPVRIDVDSQVNASAHLDRGIFSRDLVLTIGLPLAAGLEMRQFAGVLAHEFGHFTQGAGMRMGYIIYRINMWFARVVYERDSWDEALSGPMLARGGGYGFLLIGLARVAVWLTRKVLWVIMKVGHLASSFLSRQKEFDADRYQARMIGGAAVGDVLRRVTDLDLASRGAWADVNRCWGDRRLPDDFARLVVANIPQIPDEVRKAIDEQFASGRTGLFDTHPVDRERAEQALDDEPGPGILQLDGAATDLFRDFDALSRLCTFEMYREIAGNEVSREQLVPVSEVVADLAVAQEGHTAIRRYFLGSLGMLQPLPLASSVEPASPTLLAAARDRLSSARDIMLQLREANEATDAPWDDAQGRAMKAEVARVLLLTGNKVKAAEHGLTRARLPEAEEARDRALADRRLQTEARHPFEQAAASRLTMALRLLESEAFAARVPDAEILRDEARALLPCAGFLARQAVPLLADLQWHFGVLHATLAQVGQTNGQPSESLVNAVLRASGALHESLTLLQTRLGTHEPYPFEHARDDMTLARHILPPSLPTPRDAYDLYQVAQGAMGRVSEVYGRTLSRLAVAAEAVESALGLEPIPIPEPKSPPDAPAPAKI
jgi:predicted Zn finger-like uncharacterized protein